MPSQLAHSVQQEARTASTSATTSVKDELKKLAREQREASKALNVATNHAGQAAATLADKRAELAAVKESNQELHDQQIQETQVHM